MTCAPVPATASRLVACALTASSNANGESNANGSLVAADARPGRPLGNRSLCDQNGMILLRIVIPLYSSILLSMIFPENRFALFQIML
jgi:hypothetical protein